MFSVVTPAGQAIVHLEAQGYLDPAFPARMLRYRADIWENTLTAGQGTPHIHQAAVFFFPEHENKAHGLDDDGIHYVYQVVRLWEVTRDAVLSRGLVGLYPLLPLMQDAVGDTPDTVMQQALERITAAAVEDTALEQDLIAVLGIIGGEKYGPDVIRRYVRREMLMQSQVYREWIAEDIREAKAQATVEVLRENILDVLAERFTVVRQPLRAKVLAVEDVGVLKALHKLSIKAASLEEFDRQLDELISA
ncbi:hypothetical protein [Sporomusa carbonis]|uniref:hypothetical protein n=1 Tax=Sporomusa carbonis TaxID=3076075 RepID=UPI003C7BCFF5